MKFKSLSLFAGLSLFSLIFPLVGNAEIIDPAEIKVICPAELVKLCHDLSDLSFSWREKFKLRAWGLTVEVVKKVGLKPDTMGSVRWNAISRTAVIKVLDPRDYDGFDTKGRGIEEDIQYTIVHELVHLTLTPLPRDLSRKEVEEDVVTRLTDAVLGSSGNVSLEKNNKFTAAENKAGNSFATRTKK